jgi:SAM-dependent methyltransferase
MESSVIGQWCEQMGFQPWLNRKLWEYGYIAQALHERGMLQPGRRGLGFAVGQEPLVALFARLGCEIVATDLPPDHSQLANWSTTGQYAAGIDHLNTQGLCDPDLFRQRVSFRHVDMNNLPRDLRDFDFVWSACSFEHLGSINRGQRFVRNMTRCLRPGGTAVHTTEFNLSSDDRTVDNDSTVLFRQRDIQDLACWLRERGHQIDLDWTRGTGEADQYIDTPPYYREGKHLRLRLGEFVITSIGLIIEIGQPRASRRFLDWCAGLWRAAS